MLCLENYDAHLLTATKELCSAILKSKYAETLSDSTVLAIQAVILDINGIMEAEDVVLESECSCYSDDKYTAEEEYEEDSDDEYEDDEYEDDDEEEYEDTVSSGDLADLLNSLAAMMYKM